MPADAVEVAVGLREDFLKRHRKDRARADAAWRGLVRMADAFRRDPFVGTQVAKRQFPRRFAEYDNLWKLDLPHAFRAVYTVLGRPGGGIRVAVEWMGDHDECDKLFGYR